MIENDAIPVKYATRFIYLSPSDLMCPILYSVNKFHIRSSDSRVILVFYRRCGVPMMNDATLKQIAAVKAIVSKGSHVWIWNHIWQFSWDWFPLEICAHPRRNLPTGHRLSARGAVQASLLLGGLEAPPSNWQGCNVTDGFGDYCLSSAVLGGVRIRAAHAAVRSESG